jgi:hypothetical protein
MPTPHCHAPRRARTCTPSRGRPAAPLSQTWPGPATLQHRTRQYYRTSSSAPATPHPPTPIRRSSPRPSPRRTPLPAPGPRRRWLRWRSCATCWTRPAAPSGG